MQKRTVTLQVGDQVTIRVVGQGFDVQISVSHDGEHPGELVLKHQVVDRKKAGGTETNRIMLIRRHKNNV